jgi:hypothetical protein
VSRIEQMKTKRVGGLVVLGILALCLLGAGGCVRESLDGQVRTFRFEWWVPAAGVAVCLGAVGAGLFLRQIVARLGDGLLIVAVLLLLLLVPSLFLDRVTVDSEQFDLRTGFWFIPTRHHVTFDQLTQIELTKRSRATRRGTQTDYDLVCHKRSGEAERVPVGDLMEYAVQSILEAAERKGIPIHDKT